MSSLFADSALWLQVLMIGAAIPIGCFFMGLLVCVFDATAWNMFENARWYQVPLGLMGLGALVVAVLALIFGATVGIDRVINFCVGDSNVLLSSVLALIVVIGGIGFFGETVALKVSLKKQSQLGKANKKKKSL